MGEQKRFDRIVAILIQLQSKRTVRAQELADRFEVSLRTIYRDIRALEASGVPLVGEAGVGYSIMEGYRLPPIMFSREEAGSFVAAEKLMQKFMDKSLGAYHESAMYKIKSVLRGREKDWVAALESQVQIDPMYPFFNEDIPDAMEIFFESTAEKKQVFLEYHSLDAEATTQRYIEPVGIFHENQAWYVMGFCHLREDYRQFRANRIKRIKRSEKPFSREHGPLEALRTKHDDREKIRIRILVDTKIARYIENSRNHYGFVAEERRDNGVVMTFLTAGVEQDFARWFLMFGDHATILEPISLQLRIQELLNGIRNRLPETSFQKGFSNERRHNQNP